MYSVDLACDWGMSCCGGEMGLAPEESGGVMGRGDWGLRKVAKGSVTTRAQNLEWNLILALPLNSYLNLTSKVCLILFPLCSWLT